MGRDLDPNLHRAIAERLDFYRDLGIHDFYRRDTAALEQYLAEAPTQTDVIPTEGFSPSGGTTPLRAVQKGRRAVEEGGFSPPSEPSQDPALAAATRNLKPETRNSAAELRRIREDLGDCTRCPLHQQGRKQIVFGVGNPDADLMFVGEGPGADEDEQGIPFVGRAGQLLTSMITNGMGLRREDVYIANVVKCRPPGNRTPERDECETCSPFLIRQIDAVDPKVIVALGAVAARTLLGVSESMASLRGRWHDFRGRKLAVTYHPAYLLRDPRQKVETWKDLQMVMKYLGIPIPSKNPSS